MDCEKVTPFALFRVLSLSFGAQRHSWPLLELNFARHVPIGLKRLQEDEQRVEPRTIKYILINPHKLSEFLTFDAIP